MRYRSLAGTLFVLASVFLGARAITAASPPAAPDRVVFVGMQVFVERAGVKCPVVAVDRDSIRVLEHGKPVQVPMAEVGNVTSQAEPKLSTTSLMIADLAVRRGFSPGSNPRAQELRQRGTLMGIQANTRDRAQMELVQATQNAGNASAQAASGISVDVGAAQARAEGAMTAFADAISDNSLGRPEDLASPGEWEDKYDALQVHLRASAPQEIEDAYAVIRLEFRDPRNPQLLLSQIRILGLPRLGPNPRKVDLSLRGMPPGFTVESHQLHFYVDGRELATSVSSNRLEVTEDEAHRFLVLRYLQDQRTATRPVEIIRELLAPTLATLIPEALRGSIVEFVIDPDGIVTDLRFGSPASDDDADWVEVLRTVRFYPAIVKGTPVASTGIFALSEFVH